MKKIELRKKIYNRLKSSNNEDFVKKWNLIFPDEKVDLIEDKEKEYYLEILKEELSLMEKIILSSSYKKISKANID